jgi:hypothetical protein
MLLSNAMGRTLFTSELPVTLPTSDETTPPMPPFFVVAMPVRVAATADPVVAAAPTETEMVAAAAPVGTGCPS